MEVSIERQKQILILMRNQFEFLRLRSICDSLLTLWIRHQITKFEHDCIKELLVINKPTHLNEYKEFTENPYWRGHKINSINDGFWWKMTTLYPETKQIRMDYLTALINNLK